MNFLNRHDLRIQLSGTFSGGAPRRPFANCPLDTKTPGVLSLPEKPPRQYVEYTLSVTVQLNEAKMSHITSQNNPKYEI